MDTKTAKLDTRTLTLAALFAALTAIGAFLRIPTGVSSFSLQTLITVLAGVVLGARYGALSQVVYVLLGLVGLPIFIQGGGLGYVLQPTFGFLLGLIPAAWTAGALAGREGKPWRVMAASAAGMAAMYAVGLPYMYLILNLYLGRGMSPLAVVQSGMLLFLPWDMLKLVVVGVVSGPLLRAVGR